PPPGLRARPLPLRPPRPPRPPPPPGGGGGRRPPRASGDRGAISIELALAIIVMVTIAGAVLAAVKLLADKTEAKIPTDVPDSVK
ncbi:hypothetical protein, partial [Kitasatospora sp. NPDC059571]|uniref:hypothetical protein n=1 Tax=Kitasatospora sp. NPDC059571 TaxID=3346871 RepID=UPI0036841DD9